MITPRPELAALPAYRPGRPPGLADGALVNLAANESAFGPSPFAAASLASVALHRYPDMYGPSLLAQLSRAWQVDPGSIVLGTGSGHLIKCLAEAYVRPGDLALTVHPTFALYATATLLMGGQVERLPGDGHRVDFRALAARTAALRPRLLFVCSPNNPTGDALDGETLADLLAVLPEDGLLVLDEAYVHFADRPPDVPWHVRQGAGIAVLRTFSKAYGLAALRLGALLAPPAVAEAVRRVREPFPASTPALAAAAAAAADTGHLVAVREAVRAGRAGLAAGLKALGLRTNPGQGNFVWAEVPSGRATALTTSLRQEGVLVRDGTGFGVPDHVRITVGTPEETAVLLAALRRVQNGPQAP